MSHIVVIGTGIAGLTAALRLAGTHEVTLVTKGGLGQSNTAMAQGGIAGVIGPRDSIESHIADTLSAGAGLCEESAVRVLCSEGPERILELAASGVAFDAADGSPTGRWARGMEGAHSFARIFHSGGDATGIAIIDALSSALRAEVAAGSVILREDTMLVDIVTAPGGSGAAAGATAAAAGRSTPATGETAAKRVSGVTLLHAGTLEFLAADAVVLATGGAGQLYAHTTNPAAATGDGLAAAIRAGAVVDDMEFYQFHPSALAGAGFLVSEAVRGAGAILLDAHGRRFMPDVDARGELAPRDVVALAIHRTMAAQDGRPCLLDARSVPEVATRFPSITRGLADHGLSLATDLIPVTPAAHYFMGGVATDLEGRTSLDGLFAVGEVACTGVHGANRLASNSLLEGAVFGARAAQAINAGLPSSHHPTPDLELELAESPNPTGPPGGVGLTRTELQTLAWTHLGVERNDPGLRILLDRLGDAGAGVDDRLGDAGAHDETGTDLVERIETANLALIAEHIALHALAREESRGAHTRTDFPAPSAAPIRSTSALLQEASSC